MMGSKVKTCLKLSNLFTSLGHAPQMSRAYSGLAAFSQIKNPVVTHNSSVVQPHLPLFGVSVHSLPGNRCPKIPLGCCGSIRTKRTVAADSQISWNLGTVGTQSAEDFSSLSDEELQQAISFQINDSLEQGREGRLYAVVHMRSLQYKVTAGDIIVVKHDFPPNVGDKLRLEKVLAVGGSDFTLFGQPLLSRDKVFVEATVLEKTLSHNRVWFVYKKRMNFKRFHLYRERQTMLLINSVRVARLTDQQQIEDGAHQDATQNQ